LLENGDVMTNDERFDNFIKEYKDLCIKHNLYLSQANYDDIGVFELDIDENEIFTSWLENKIS